MIRPIIAASIALICFAIPLRAEIAMVRGGEHPGFTRIAVQLRDAGDWRLGRSPGGYALQLPSEITGFDLSFAFDRISRSRVAAVRRDPQTGRL